MSITEKTNERLARIHSALQAQDWIPEAMYDEAQHITMNAWALMVANEIKRRSLERRVA
jgi:hypothetical protein